MTNDEMFELDGFGEDDDVDIEMALANLAAIGKVSKKKVGRAVRAKTATARLAAKRQPLLTTSNKQLLLGVGVGLLLAYFVPQLVARSHRRMHNGSQ